jgi:hypothetical protein
LIERWPIKSRAIRTRFLPKTLDAASGIFQKINDLFGA